MITFQRQLVRRKTVGMVSAMMAISLVAAVPAQADQGLASEFSNSEVDAALISSSMDGLRAAENLLATPGDTEQLSDGSIVGTTTTGGTIDIPAELEDGISVANPDGEDFTVELPGAEDSGGPVTLDNGAVAFPAGESSANSVVATDDGVQMLTTIANDTAAERYAYDFDLPDGAALALDEESGAVTATTGDGSWIFGVMPAWATDAAGSSIPTHYEVEGHRLTQVVEHQQTKNVVYPVVADPWLGIALIKSFKWVKSSKGYTISVAVTPWMGVVGSGAAIVPGWDELKNKVKAKGSTQYNRLNKKAMFMQWSCHGIGKAAIGVGGWLGLDKKPTWDLETWRSASVNPAKMVTKRCNW